MTTKKKLSKELTERLPEWLGAEKPDTILFDGKTVTQVIKETRWIKLYLLFRHYGLSPNGKDAGLELAFKLALDYVPGMQFGRRKGRPRSPTRSFLLTKILPGRSGRPTKWGTNEYLVLLRARELGEEILRRQNSSARVTDIQALDVMIKKAHPTMPTEKRRKKAQQLAKRLPDARNFVRKPT